MTKLRIYHGLFVVLFGFLALWNAANLRFTLGAGRVGFTIFGFAITVFCVWSVYRHAKSFLATFKTLPN